MSTEQAAASQRWIVSGACLLIGLIVGLLALQRLTAYAPLVFESGEVSDALAGGSPLPEDATAAAIGRRAWATRIIPGDADIQVEIARLEQRRAGSADARQRLEQALAAGPGKGFIWALLARSERDGNGSPERVVFFLRYSYLLAPVEASALLQRVPVALASWDSLPEDVRSNLAKDLKEVWSTVRMKNYLISLYLKASLRERILIRSLLLDSDLARKQFDDQILRAAGIKPR